eukprot:15359130-Ditylum_brightwellii.AAC.1
MQNKQQLVVYDESSALLMLSLSSLSPLSQKRLQHCKKLEPESQQHCFGKPKTCTEQIWAIE